MHNKDENLQKPSFMRVFLDELLERFWDTFGIKNEIADLDKFAKTQKKKARILVAMLVIVIVFCSLTVTGTTLVVKFLHSRQVERLEDKIDETEKLLKNAQGHIDNLKAQLDNILT